MLEQKIKPTVRFRKGTGTRTLYRYPSRGDYVIYEGIYALDHPILGEGYVRTSVVLKEFQDGSFETLNTWYFPVDAACVELGDAADKAEEGVYAKV